MTIGSTSKKYLFTFSDMKTCW